MKNLLYLLPIFLSLSCSNDNQNDKLVLNENESLVFSTYAGDPPVGFKPTFYKLTNSQVLKDEMSGFAFEANNSQVNFIDLGSDKFNLTKDLINYFPNKLLTIERRIGNPGAADGGILYLQLTKNGVAKIWELDSDPNAVPEELRVFVRKVNEKINLLN